MPAAEWVKLSCLGDTRVIEARTEFVIAEHRITVSWLHSDRRDNGKRERGVSVCGLVAAVHTGRSGVVARVNSQSRARQRPQPCRADP
jgi:hypothetical protein